LIIFVLKTELEGNSAISNTILSINISDDGTNRRVLKCRSFYVTSKVNGVMIVWITKIHKTLCIYSPTEILLTIAMNNTQLEKSLNLTMKTYGLIKI
jgi:hypothetical protein